MDHRVSPAAPPLHPSQLRGEGPNVLKNAPKGHIARRQRSVRASTRGMVDGARCSTGITALVFDKTLSRTIRSYEKGGQSRHLVPMSGTRRWRREPVHVDQSAEIGCGDDAG
jgi:hypothetical protein